MECNSSSAPVQSRAVAEQAASRPSSRALIVTLYGLYARETGGWLSVAAVVALLSHLEVDEMAVRSSISRLKSRGLLQPERIGPTAGYRLSHDALSVFEEGDRRIFDRSPAAEDEAWALAVFSVPEAERARRHQLRSRLSWLGFGTVSSGVWIAPGHLLPETREMLARHGLDAYVDLFRGEHAAFAATRDRVAEWWDLSALQDFYADFITRYRPMLRDYRRRRRAAGPAAFADYVSVLTAWRRLPYLDPGLPQRFLPAGWPGNAAAEVFFELHDRLAAPAHEFATGVLDARR